MLVSPFFLEVTERLWLYSVLLCVWRTSSIECFLLYVVVHQHLCWEVPVALLCWQQSWDLVAEGVGVTKWRTVPCTDCRRPRHPQQQCLPGTSAAAQALSMPGLAVPCLCCWPGRSASRCGGQTDGCVIEFCVFGAQGWLGHPLHPVHCSVREWAGLIVHSLLSASASFT